MSGYPEHDKLRAVRDRLQAIDPAKLDAEKREMLDLQRKLNGEPHA